ncbi:EAL domain-containing protein [Microbacterium sulfonylureivorans]|uniref:EAL domain-containing protein n=1 Tax=Microbacterium sulfonylureivorans TaxID=2486854 RepID=UPI000FDB26B0|nr:EAL domain-containing protein [Microbacterium sulfonylureivorans]
MVVLTGMVVIVDGELASDLMGALHREELFAAFQPQIDLASGAIVAAEVLCRWLHPRHGLVDPDVFIPLSEEIGAIDAIGRFVLDEGLDAAETWQARGLPVEVAVNVSPVQLVTDEFVEHLTARLAQRAVAPGSLTLEITESRPLGDLDGIGEQLERLRRRGVGIALDDFGTGHASPAALERLPVTEVKLDRSLIHAVASEPPAHLVSALQTARHRDLRVVAEGIETQEHLDRARELGCDRAQGYLLGRPMPFGELDALMAS